MRDDMPRWEDGREWLEMEDELADAQARIAELETALATERRLIESISKIIDKILDDMGIPRGPSYPRGSAAWALSAIAEGVAELLELRGEHQ